MSRYSCLKNKVFKIQQPEGQTKFDMTNQFDTEGKYRILQHLILLLSKYIENYVCNFLFYSYEIFKSFFITSYYFYLSILTFLSLSDIAVTLSLSLIQITNFLMGFLSPMIVPSDLPSLIFPGWNALSKCKYVIIFLHRHFHHCLRTMDEPRFLSWFTGSLTSFVNPSPPLMVVEQTNPFMLSGQCGFLMKRICLDIQFPLEEHPSLPLLTEELSSSTLK